MARNHFKFMKDKEHRKVIGRKAFNTIEKIERVATPILGFGTLVQPEFAPIAGGASLAIKGAKEIAHLFV